MVTCSVEVDRPAAAVFPNLEQFERTPNVSRAWAAPKSGTEGPIRVGTRVIERQ